MQVWNHLLNHLRAIASLRMRMTILMQQQMLKNCSLGERQERKLQERRYFKAVPGWMTVLMLLGVPMHSAETFTISKNALDFKISKNALDSSINLLFKKRRLYVYVLLQYLRAFGLYTESMHWSKTDLQCHRLLQDRHDILHLFKTASWFCAHTLLGQVRGEPASKKARVQEDGREAADDTSSSDIAELDEALEFLGKESRALPGKAQRSNLLRRIQFCETCVGLLQTFKTFILYFFKYWLLCLQRDWSVCVLESLLAYSVDHALTLVIWEMMMHSPLRQQWPITWPAIIVFLSVK